jgi:hypothetical protein
VHCRAKLDTVEKRKISVMYISFIYMHTQESNMMEFEILMSMKIKIVVLKVMTLWVFVTVSREFAASIFEVDKVEGNRFLQNIGNCSYL